QATSYKLQATSYKLQATSYKLQATSYACGIGKPQFVPGFLVNGNALPIVEFGDMQDLMPL
ncbi:MAG: hypothetical protein CL537_06960, partial [Alcanivoracaceae bacterium]|nr:hypothetical protein [Alcanivoracaceae bacterium]